jgi:8-oxo-dGTP pyrophosphatase MutT (NUDIX family)
MSTGCQGKRAGGGEDYNPGPATVPRPAASVILLRGGADALEVLLVRRTPKARFMGGVWVFPGGSVEERDARAACSRRADAPGAVEARALRAAAMRELHEEAGIALADTDELVELSRWITPAEVRTRFDTHFFLATLPRGQEPHVDGKECVAHRWFAPQAALDADRAQQILLVFPTIKHLEQLARFHSATALLQYARGREVQPVQPRILLDAGATRIVLPGDPGY